LTSFHPKKIRAHPLVKEFYRSIDQSDVPDVEFEQEQEETPVATEEIPIVEAFQLPDELIDYSIPQAYVQVIKQS
jgi:hypothetical protein